MGLIGDVKAFLAQKKKKQCKDVDRLSEIITNLRAKATGIHKRLEDEEESAKKEKLEKEFKAVKKLLKKSKKRYRKLVEEKTDQCK